MSDFTTVQPDPSMIGRLLPPAFAVLAEGHDMAPYLQFLQALASVQADLAAGLPPPLAPDAARTAEAAAGAMPPLDRAHLRGDPALRDLLRQFLATAAAVPMPEQAAEALAALRAADDAALDEAAGNVLADSIPVDAIAAHLFVSCAVQLHVARLAAALDAATLKPVAPGTCPACGGPPVASRVVGWPGAENSRYAACSCCGTQWSEVRVKCLACGSTKGVAYRSVETEEATVKAECCDECRSWVKILYANKNPALDPVADDVSSLGLDLLMGETEYRRAGFDPFLIGY